MIFINNATQNKNNDYGYKSNRNHSQSISKKNRLSKDEVSFGKQEKGVINQKGANKKTGKIIGIGVGLASIVALGAFIIKKGKIGSIIVDEIKRKSALKKQKAQDALKTAEAIKNTKKIRDAISDVSGVKEIKERIASYPWNCNPEKVEQLDDAKSIFDFNVKSQADVINCLKKDSKNKELLDFYTKKDAFTQSFLLLGEDEKAKQKLIDFYVKQAKESDIAIEKFNFVENKEIIGYGRTNIQDFVNLSEKCAERFEKENKLSLIVIENAEGFLKEENLGSAMGHWNELSQYFRKQGISAIATAKNIEELNESAVRGGRLDYKILVDKMTKEINEKL